MSLPGASSFEIANALSAVTSAARKIGKPVDPQSLKGDAAKAYAILLGLGVPASGITMYQNNGGSFSAVLLAAAYQALITTLF